ncbi:unnamed protein product [Timema podura]|uniref:Thioredoxin domain-containing protein n=1 Tax=Timema podura TaxID=61482 RepID=A0ABN7NNL5_TIMPD|nr:unnamed protein product [Timema podura]
MESAVVLNTTSALANYATEAENFDRLVLQSDSLWIVEFYAPWCGHCQSFADEYSKAATALKGVSMVGAINVDEHKSLGAKYGVKGYPTIKIFGANKQQPDDYNGARSAHGIIEAAFSSLRAKVNEQLNGRKSGRGGSKHIGREKHVCALERASKKAAVQRLLTFSCFNIHQVLTV